MEVDVYIQSEDGEFRKEKLDIEGTISVGRSPQCSLCLKSDRVSRLHFVMDTRLDGIWLEDRSSNGTLAGDVLLRREGALVAYGTPIVLGDYTIHVSLPGGPQAGVPMDFASRAQGAGSPLMPDPYAVTAHNPAASPEWAASMEETAGTYTGGPGNQGVGDGTYRGPTNHPDAQYRPTNPPDGQYHGGGSAPAPGYRVPAPADSQGWGGNGNADHSPWGAGGHPEASQWAQQNAPHHSPSSLPEPAVDRVVLSDAIMPRDPVTEASVRGPSAGSATGPMAATGGEAATPEDVKLRREIHAKLLENLDLAKLDATKLDDPSMRPRVLTALRRIVRQLDARIPKSIDRDTLVGELADEALGLGPLERFLSDPTINEIMVVDPNSIYIEQGGKLTKADARFTDDERVRAVIERIVTPLGRRIDESSPLVDARLKDGSRVNAIIKPLALRGSCITIRKFAKVPLTIPKLIGFGALTMQMARFLERSVLAKKNIIISGGTGSGKTTLLNVLSGAIPSDERIVTIEDAAELQLSQPHVVSLESRPPNMEGRGEYTIRDLVRNALRMRPDRIVVGECRGGEALDMLQAMNTGHDGSLTTTHANSPIEAIGRIETLVLMGGVDLPSRAIREQIAASIHLVVQQTRFTDGSRRISSIAEVVGIEDDEIVTRNIFEFVRTGTGPAGQVVGEHRATGYLPSFLDAFIVGGLVRPGEPYL